ncbi:hypothetical protein CMEL01_06393 [Colletotrichum melonis]|uniref:Secreted protein n=1 Tax=Colletotrichum melonis TaxID=1209925 RepID=A0AAI9U512_9PEZI|nr:hypothetical protein CMEL01_06393 [Colletotrichum melonis]
MMTLQKIQLVFLLGIGWLSSNPSFWPPWVVAEPRHTTEHFRGHASNARAEIPQVTSIVITFFHVPRGE